MDRTLRARFGLTWATVVALWLAPWQAGAATTAEELLLPGPELTNTAQPVEHLPASLPATAPTLSEMPVADSADSADKTIESKTAGSESASKLAHTKADDLDRDRSPQLEQVAQQADRQTRHGYELAGRGAYFAARAEFIGALRLVAEGLDTEYKTTSHSRALGAAITAIKEAKDFLPGERPLGDESGLAEIIATHTTPVLKNQTETATSLVALRSYFTFAQEQLAAAAGHEVAGGMALHALGKLHAALAQKNFATNAASESKAMVFFQASLLVYPNNHMAANDLGVLLARNGRLADAQAMLCRSIALRPESATWRNLAIVCQRLGQPVDANRAAQQASYWAQIEKSRQQAAGTSNVRWVAPQSLAQNTTGPTGYGVTPPATAKSTTAAAGPAARTTNIPGYPRWTSSAAPAPAASNAVSPAATPAAAQRMSWGAAGYQR